MKTSSVIFAFSLILSIYGQQWTEPLSIFDSVAPITFQKHWIDEETLVKHYIYAVQETRRLNQLYYRKVFTNGSLSEPIAIMPGQTSGYSSDITGANDGKRIFIVANVKRDTDPVVFDVYFLESINGGANWSKPVQVPRKEMNDEIGRFYANIKFSEDKERLWIAYFVANEADVQYFMWLYRLSRVFYPFSTKSGMIM